MPLSQTASQDDYHSSAEDAEVEELFTIRRPPLYVCTGLVSDHLVMDVDELSSDWIFTGHLPTGESWFVGAPWFDQYRAKMQRKDWAEREPLPCFIRWLGPTPYGLTGYHYAEITYTLNDMDDAPFWRPAQVNVVIWIFGAIASDKVPKNVRASLNVCLCQCYEEHKRDYKTYFIRDE